MDRTNDLRSWRIFAAVAKSGNISAVCGRFDADAAQLSRILQQLEKALGCGPLFDRSMRPLALTENGRTALGYAEKMLRLRDDMEAELSHDPEALAGVLRVGLPPMLFRDYLTPALMRFTGEHPEIDLRVDEYGAGMPVDFTSADGRFFDVVASYGPSPANRSIVQINYGRGLFIPCASPAYLRRFGTPETPADLVRHTGIVVSTSMRRSAPALRRGDEQVPIEWGRQIVFSSATAAKTAVLLGTGVHINLATLHCCREIEAGALVPILRGWEQPALGLYLYTRPDCLKLARVRLFMRWFRERMIELHEDCVRMLTPWLTPAEIEVIRPILL